MFLMCLDLIFLKKHMQMLYVDHLQHGLDTSPFSIPCCAFLDSKTIQSVASMDRRGDVPSGRIEVQASQGKLQIYCVQLFQSLYEKCVICYFIYHSFLFSLFLLYADEKRHRYVLWRLGGQPDSTTYRCSCTCLSPI
jgi:hypothetical protein